MEASDSAGWVACSDRRLLIFTEFRDTLDYLVTKLRGWGFAVECIHGSMKPGSRDEPGTRLYAEQKFRDGPLQGGATGQPEKRWRTGRSR